jgi:uncharacterized protein (DUF1330 family)
MTFEAKPLEGEGIGSEMAPQTSVQPPVDLREMVCYKSSPDTRYALRSGGTTKRGEAYVAAYVIAEVTITDPQGFEAYRQMVPATVAKYGGKFVVRGGALEKLEGNWEPMRLVIIEFESAERAMQWWASEDYREAKELRQRTAQTNLIVIEGA